MPKLKKSKLTDENTKLEKSVKRADTEITELMKQLGEVSQELIDKKASLDQELEEYALTRKQEIKASILEENTKYTVILEKIRQSNIKLEARKTELRELNQIYLDEQGAIKQSSLETERLLTENKEKVVEVKAQVDELEQQAKELEYKKNQAQIALVKTKEEHNKFLEYERQTRKLLDDKDRQLQEKAAGVVTGNQFLKNQRSYLPPM